ncbi:MAG: methionine synthase [Candidatus Odinarchaeia archaeon]
MKIIKPLTTTVIGSYPANNFSGIEAVKYAVEKQIEAGIDIISDGQTRTDMIRYFTDHIPGFTYEGDKLKIDSRIQPPKETPIVKDLIYAKKLLKNNVVLKGIITGPVTLIASSKVEKSSGYNGFLDQKLYVELGEALRREIELISQVGVTYIQIDEPFYSVGAPLDLAMQSIKIITENLKLPVGLHVCGDSSKVFDKLVLFPGVDILSLEFKASPENFTAISKDKILKYDKMLGVGCVNSKSNEIESISEIQSTISKAIELVGAENIIIHPDCGLRLLKPQAAFNKLKNMVEAVKKFK